MVLEHNAREPQIEVARALDILDVQRQPLE
jgi:hypothetical protein